MKYFLIFSAFWLSLTLHGQDKATYFHDGEHHYLVDGIDVSDKSPSILLNNAIMFEYDAKIYLVKQTDAVEGTGKKIAGALVNDRTQLKGWGIDFYTKIGDSFVIYFNGNFRNPEQFFLGVDDIAYGYSDNSYFRLNKYETAAEGVFEEIFVYEDGIWWRDGADQLFGLRNGEAFQGDVYPFKKGVMARDSQTNEYLWFTNFTGKTERNTVNSMELTPEAIVINIANDPYFGRDYFFIGKPFYRGKPLDDGSIEREMDRDKAMYYFDSKLGKAFYGIVPESGLTMEIIEIEVPISESKAYWISDSYGDPYLQIGDDIWQEYLESKGDYKVSGRDRSGNFYKYSGPAKMKPWVLYPATVYR